MQRHLKNLREIFGMRAIVAINHFTADTDAEVELLRRKISRADVPVVVSRHWADGGAGALDLAHAVVGAAEAGPSEFRLAYEDSMPLWEKIKTIATKIYGASEIPPTPRFARRSKNCSRNGFGHYPVCIAKTQYSFSTDPLLRGAPEFLVAVCGDIYDDAWLAQGSVGDADGSGRIGQGRRAVLGFGAKRLRSTTL